jgi:hypothetical protein
MTLDADHQSAHPGSVAMSLAPLGLALLGAVVPLVASSFTPWGMALIWLAVIALVALGRAIARPKPPTRVFLDLIGLAMTLVVLAPEGGWWFVPAVVAQLLLDRRVSLEKAQTT